MKKTDYFVKLKCCRGFTRFTRVWLLTIIIQCLGFLCCAEASEALIFPHRKGQLIDGWGFDIKWAAKANDVTPSYAHTLFVEDRMNMLRIPIWGDENFPAHPGPGQVIAEYYEDTLNAMTNARNANADVLFFASKKLQGRNSFPDWVKDSTGIIPDQYALMLADFLEFMESHGFFIHILGIDNERKFNEGNITPRRHKNTIDELRILAGQRDFNVPVLIGPDTFGPGDGATWLDNLFDNGWDDRLDIAGTHYYPGPRPLSQLRNFAAAARFLPKWHTEVHFTRASTLGVDTEIERSERCLAAIFDSFDEGFSQMVWWNYSREDLHGGIRRAITSKTANAYPIEIIDHDGQAIVYETLITRAFRQDGNRIIVWVVNNTDDNHSEYGFTLNTGSISSPVNYRQWNNDSHAEGFLSTATITSPNRFVVDVPKQTVTVIVFDFSENSVPYPSIHYPFDGSVNDTSFHHYDGVIIGQEAYTEGVLHQAFDFNGDTYIEVPGFTGISGKTFRTVSAWVKPEALGNNATILSWGPHVAGQQFLFGVFSNGGIGIYSGGPLIRTNASISSGQWHHVAAVLPVDNTPSIDQIRLYIDGQRETDIYASSSEIINTIPAGNVLIGAFEISPGQTTSYFHGGIDDVRIYDYALDDQEIAYLTFLGQPDSRVCIPAINQLTYDYNHDCIVDLSDLLVFAHYWLSQKGFAVFNEFSAEWLADDFLQPNLILNGQFVVSITNAHGVPEDPGQQWNASPGDFASGTSPLTWVDDGTYIQLGGWEWFNIEEGRDLALVNDDSFPHTLLTNNLNTAAVIRENNKSYIATTIPGTSLRTDTIYALSFDLGFFDQTGDWGRTEQLGNVLVEIVAGEVVTELDTSGLIDPGPNGAMARQTLYFTTGDVTEDLEIRIGSKGGFDGGDRQRLAVDNVVFSPYFTNN